LASNPIILGCEFTGNVAFDAGGGIYNNESSPTVEACILKGNRSANIGGGIYNSQSSPTVTNCVFIANKAQTAGGGMYNLDASPSVVNCIFRGNQAHTYGAGMYNGRSSSTVINCSFSGNTAFNGAGMANLGSSPAITTISNCTFSGNIAFTTGGGILNLSSSPITITDSILWGDVPEFANLTAENPTILYTDLQGGGGEGVGNIDADPMFVRPPDPGPDGLWDGVDDDYGDLRLQPGSPCINAGDPDFVPQPGETDLDGHARLLCGRVDMGAYEFGIGDYDCDHAVDLTDFANWEACATDPSLNPNPQSLDPPCLAFDFDADADVDLVDFYRLQQIVISP